MAVNVIRKMKDEMKDVMTMVEMIVKEKGSHKHRVKEKRMLARKWQNNDKGERWRRRKNEEKDTAQDVKKRTAENGEVERTKTFMNVTFNMKNSRKCKKRWRKKWKGR